MHKLMQNKTFEIEATQLVELSQDELMQAQGGESAWYWVAYGIGSAVHAYHTVINDPSYSTPIA